MKTKWDYDHTNEEIVDKVIDAAREYERQYGTVGLKFDLSEGVCEQELLYWKGVLLARLDNAKPPFEPGCCVTTKNTKGVWSSVNYYGKMAKALPSKRYTIERIFYQGNGKWSLLFEKEETGCRYPAEHFVKIRTSKK